MYSIPTKLLADMVTREREWAHLGIQNEYSNSWNLFFFCFLGSALEPNVVVVEKVQIDSLYRLNPEREFAVDLEEFEASLHATWEEKFFFSTLHARLISFWDEDRVWMW